MRVHYFCRKCRPNVTTPDCVRIGRCEECREPCMEMVAVPGMSREELVALLRSLALPFGSPGAHDDAGDTERAHKAADKALLAYIDDPEVTAAFTALERWYA